MAATFGGATIFGQSVSIVIRDTPTERQENAYPGLSGVESIPMGGRGRYAEASGFFYAASGINLTTLENVFRAYKDGRARALVDTTGYAWPYAILEAFDPQGKIRLDTKYGFCRTYTARFRLLI